MTTLPSEALHYPWPNLPLPSGVEAMLGLSDWVSPSWYLRKGIEIAVGTDPVAWLSAEFAGDWNKVSQAGTALEQLGEYVEALAREVDGANLTLSATWDGRAAVNAEHYFEVLATSIAALRPPLADIGNAFHSTAQGMKSTAATIEDLLGLLMDYLIEIGIAACATGAFSWTGVGLAIGGAGTAYLAYKASSTWLKIVEAHGHASTICKGVMGLIAGSLSLLDIDDSLELPGAYDHPSVP